MPHARLYLRPSAALVRHLARRRPAGRVDHISSALLYLPEASTATLALPLPTTIGRECEPQRSLRMPRRLAYCPVISLAAVALAIVPNIWRAAANRGAAAATVGLVGVVRRAGFAIVLQEVVHHRLALIVQVPERARASHLQRVGGHDWHCDRAVGVADDRVGQLVGVD